MANWFSCLIGEHTLDVAPKIGIDADRVIRENADPVECVAINYVLTLLCRVREDADDTAAVKLGDELAAYFHTRTCPRIRIQDDQGDEIPEIGLIDEAALDEDDVNLGWEDPRIIGFSLPTDDGQLRAGATFTLTIAVRRSFPDEDGVCEFFQEREVTPGATEVRRLTTRLRIAKWTGYTVETPAIAARLREDAEVGWIRTIGAEPLGFMFREPLTPLRHVAETVSEVLLSGGVTGGTGSTAARTGVTVEEDPNKGIRRLTYTAETEDGDDPTGWVEAQEPGGALVSTETSSAEGSKRSASATWRKVEALAPQGKTTKVTRTFDLTGGRRVTGAARMSPPTKPHIQTGPFDAYELTETLTVYALGATGFGDFVLPAPLAAPWLLGPVTPALPRVDEEAVDAAQLLFVYTVVRTYLWDSTEDPLAHETLKGAVFVVTPKTGAGGEPAGGFDFA